MMITLRYLDNNRFLIRYNGDRSDFNLYIDIILNKLLYCASANTESGGGWLFHYSKLEEVTKLFKNIEYLNEYIEPNYMSMGKDMKLQPYEYQKEAIHYAINNLNSLMVLPCGSGR